MSMSIRTRPGDRVVFANTKSGYQHDIEAAARYLVHNQSYIVESIRVSRSSTAVTLKDVPGSWNSVLFNNDMPAVMKEHTGMLLGELAELPKKTASMLIKGATRDEIVAILSTDAAIGIDDYSKDELRQELYDAVVDGCLGYKQMSLRKLRQLLTQSVAVARD